MARGEIASQKLIRSKRRSFHKGMEKFHKHVANKAFSEKNFKPNGAFHGRLVPDLSHAEEIAYGQLHGQGLLDGMKNRKVRTKPVDADGDGDNSPKKADWDEIKKKGAMPIVHENTDEMTGGGNIFGSLGDKALDWMNQKTGRDVGSVIRKAADVAKPYAKQALNAGIEAGADYLSAANPALAPALQMGKGHLKKFAGDYLDDPSRYNGYDDPRKQASSMMSRGRQMYEDEYEAPRQRMMQRMPQPDQFGMGGMYDYANFGGMPDMYSMRGHARRMVDDYGGGYGGYGLGGGAGKRKRKSKKAFAALTAEEGGGLWA